MNLNIEEDKCVTKWTPALWLSHACNAQYCHCFMSDHGFWQWLPTQSSFLNRGSKRPPVFIYDVLLLNNLKIRSVCLKAGSDNQYFFQSLEAMMYGGRKWLQTSRKLMLLLSEWEVNPRKKILDPGVIWTKDLLNTSQTCLPLGHLDPWQRSRRQST